MNNNNNNNFHIEEILITPRITNINTHQIQSGSTATLQKTLFSATELLEKASTHFQADVLQVLRRVWRIINSYGNGNRYIFPPHPNDYASESELNYMNQLLIKLVDGLFNVLKLDPYNDKLLHALKDSVVELQSQIRKLQISSSTSNNSNNNNKKHWKQLIDNEPLTFSRARIRIRLLYLATLLLTMCPSNLLEKQLTFLFERKDNVQTNDNDATFYSDDLYLPNPIIISEELSISLLCSMGHIQILLDRLDTLVESLNIDIGYNRAFFSVVIVAHLLQYYPHLFRGDLQSTLRRHRNMLIDCMENIFYRSLQVANWDSSQVITNNENMKRTDNINNNNNNNNKSTNNKNKNKTSGANNSNNNNNNNNNNSGGGFKSIFTLLTSPKKQNKNKRLLSSNKTPAHGKKLWIPQGFEQSNNNINDAAPTTVNMVAQAAEELWDPDRNDQLNNEITSVNVMTTILSSTPTTPTTSFLKFGNTNNNDPLSIFLPSDLRLNFTTLPMIQHWLDVLYSPDTTNNNNNKPHRSRGTMPPVLSTRLRHTILKYCIRVIEQTHVIFSYDNKLLREGIPLQRRKQQFREYLAINENMSIFDDANIDIDHEYICAGLINIIQILDSLCSAVPIAIKQIAPYIQVLLQHMLPPIITKNNHNNEMDSSSSDDILTEGHKYGVLFVNILRFCIHHELKLESTPFIVPSHLLVNNNNNNNHHHHQDDNNQTMSLDIEYLINTLFNWFLCHHYMDTFVAYEVVQFCIEYKSHPIVLAQMVEHFPLLLKIVSQYPTTFARQFSILIHECLSYLLSYHLDPKERKPVRQSLIGCTELLHNILDLPLVGATIEFHQKLLDPRHADSAKEFLSLLVKDDGISQVFRYLLRNLYLPQSMNNQQEKKRIRPHVDIMSKHYVWTGTVSNMTPRISLTCEIVPILLQTYFESMFDIFEKYSKKTKRITIVISAVCKCIFERFCDIENDDEFQLRYQMYYNPKKARELREYLGDYILDLIQLTPNILVKDSNIFMRLLSMGNFTKKKNFNNLSANDNNNNNNNSHINELLEKAVANCKLLNPLISSILYVIGDYLGGQASIEAIRSRILDDLSAHSFSSKFAVTSSDLSIKHHDELQKKEHLFVQNYVEHLEELINHLCGLLNTYNIQIHNDHVRKIQKPSWLNTNMSEKNNMTNELLTNNYEDMNSKKSKESYILDIEAECFSNFETHENIKKILQCSIVAIFKIGARYLDILSRVRSFFVRVLKNWNLNMDIQHSVQEYIQLLQQPTVSHSLFKNAFAISSQSQSQYVDEHTPLFHLTKPYNLNMSENSMNFDQETNHIDSDNNNLNNVNLADNNNNNNNLNNVNLVDNNNNNNLNNVNLVDNNMNLNNQIDNDPRVDINNNGDHTIIDNERKVDQISIKERKADDDSINERKADVNESKTDDIDITVDDTIKTLNNDKKKNPLTSVE